MRRIVAAIFNRSMRLTGLKHCLLMGLLCLVLSGAAEAIPVFNLTTPDKTVTLAVGATATITYTVQNNTGVDIPSMKYSSPPLTTLAAGSTCSSVLAKGASCNLLLTVRAPNTASGHIFLESLRVCGFSKGMVCSTSDKENRVQLNIINATQGHFVFRQGATDITNLDLAPGATGTVTLHNTGGSIISGYSLTIPAAVSSYFSGTCTSVTSLAAGASCNLAYTIPAVPASGIHNLVAAGTNADNTPHTLVVTTVPTRVFVTNAGDNTVVSCTVDMTTGAFTACVNTGGTGFNNLSGIALNAAGTRVFVVNRGGSTVSTCVINTITGAFTACVNAGGTGFNNPSGIALNAAGTRVFVVNIFSDIVTTCTVNPSTGAFSGCTNTGSGLSLPYDIALHSQETRAFVSTDTGTVVTCVVSLATGAFSGCVDTGGTGFSESDGLFLNANNTRAFINNYNTNTVSTCAVNPTTGTFSACTTATNLLLNNPYGLALNTAGTRVFVVNLSSNIVTTCTVNPSTGIFSACIDTGGTGFFSPRYIAIGP